MTPGLLIEIGSKSWLAAEGDELMEFPLDFENGQPTAASRERLIAGLRGFINKKGSRTGRRVLVAIGARGVSLRRLTLPPAPKEELQRVLRLQIENEFPLSPDELAWGWQLLGEIAGRPEALVAAVKKEVIENASQILAACGLTASFTLSALARNALRPPSPPNCAVLHVGPVESELLTFKDGAPSGIRLVGWGAESGTPPPAWLKENPSGGPLCLTGWFARSPSVASQFPQSSVLEWGVIDDRSAAIAGLRKWSGISGPDGPLLIQSQEGKSGGGETASWKWAVAAAALIVALLGFPYAEAIVLQPRLQKKLAALKSDRDRLPAIDRELDFLQYIKRNQPPYLDTLYLIAKLAPSGTSLESVSMSRRGDFSIRGKLPNAGELMQFRSNLVQSAWFSSVVVEEQSPTPDRKLTVRLSAQIKPVDSRKPFLDEKPKNSPETNAAGPIHPAKK